MKRAARDARARHTATERGTPRLARRRAWRAHLRRLWVAYTILVAGTLLTGGLTYYVAHMIAASERARFERQAHQIELELVSRTARYVDTLRAAQGMLRITGSISATEWHDFVQSLDLEHRYSGVGGLGYIPRVPQADEASFVAAVRAQGVPDYTIAPPGERAEYFPILYREPNDANGQRALGYDGFTDPVRRAAMEQARDTGQPTATGKVVLASDQGYNEQPAFIIYLPIYRTGSPLDTVEERRAALQGFIFASLRVDALMGNLGTVPDASQIDIEIFDGTTLNADRLLYDNDTTLDAGVLSSHRHLVQRNTLTIAGRLWTISISTHPNFEQAPNQWEPWAVAGSGAVITLLLFWLVRLLEQRQQQAKVGLRASEARQQAIIDTAFDAILTMDLTGRIQDFNPAAERIFGYRAAEVVGQPFTMLMAERFRRLYALGLKRYQNVGKAPAVGRTQELVGRRKDGTEFAVELSVAEARQEGETLITGILRDVSERKTFEQQLRHQAFHDALTGLPNRALLVERLEHALTRASRHAEQVAILFLDLDRFKVVNDSLGHQSGDALLVAVAQRLRECVRPEDTVARLGGDEFTILVEEMTDVWDAARVAERVIAALQEPFTLDGREVFISTSIGIALSSRERDTPTELMRDADVALYRAKARGRGAYEVFDASMNAATLERLELEGELRHAPARGELSVHYQPKVWLTTGRIEGVEALMRWRHPTRGFVSPAAFIPLAEETGLIHALGRWILTEACRQIRVWQERHPDEPPLVLCVNLSARQFQHPELVEEVAAVLRDTRLAPHTLMLEITESVVIEDVEASNTMLRRLKQLGVQLAIDDFGTGYSSLSYLKSFPVDALKIDKAFIDRLGQAPEDTAIVQAVITLAHTLGMLVIAEGVETAAQVAQLRALGCDLGQGYYFAKPLPADSFEVLLDAEPAHGSSAPLAVE